MRTNKHFFTPVTDDVLICYVLAQKMRTPVRIYRIKVSCMKIIEYLSTVESDRRNFMQNCHVAYEKLSFSFLRCVFTCTVHT